MFYLIYIIFIYLLNIIKCDEEKRKMKPLNETLLKWAKKKNIKFSDKIKLNFTS